MAEGGQWQRSFNDTFSNASGDADGSFHDTCSNASGDADESFCDPCKTEGESIPATGYCQTCDEYMCVTCHVVHRKQAISRAHVILDQKQMLSRPGYVNKYNKERLSMTFVRSIGGTSMVQVIPTWFQNSKDFRDIEQHLQNLEVIMDSNDANLEKNYINILRDITSARRKINTYLDAKHTQITDEAIQMKKTDEKELNILQAKHRAMKEEVRKMLHDCKVDGYSINKNKIIKQVKDKMNAMEIEIKRVTQTKQKKYHFQMSKEIDKIIEDKTPLGKLSRKSAQEFRTIVKRRESMRSRVPTREITATYNRSINVKDETDNKICRITGTTLLSTQSGDRLVVADENNKNVKFIDLNSNTVISSYFTSSAPWGVTALSANKIAVSLPVERTIKIFDVMITSTFTFQREIVVQNACLEWRTKI